MDTIDINTFPVMKKQCLSCPFRTDSTGRHPDPVLVSKIQQQCLSKVSQLCHHPRLEGKLETHLCRGARDYQNQMFYRLGVLDAPTDEAWNKTAACLLE